MIFMLLFKNRVVKPSIKCILYHDFIQDENICDMRCYKCSVYEQILFKEMMQEENV